MSRLTFQIGKESDCKSNVLTWRLPKRVVSNNPIVSKLEAGEKPRPVFDRRAPPPAKSSDTWIF